MAIKKNLSNKISNRKIDNILINLTLKNIVLNCWVLGGGFIYVSGKNHEKIIKTYFVSLKIKPDSNGSQIIYYEKWKNFMLWFR